MRHAAPPTRAPTILDVARLADVSKSTVSNVVRGAANVTAETRARVLQAVATLGYRPNVLARQLVQPRAGLVGVVVGDLSNPFHAEMAQRVERAAAARGYRTMFCSTRSDEAAERDGLEGLLEWRVAGILFLAHAGRSDAARRLVQGRVPCVFVTCEAPWGDVVCADDSEGGAAATAHLLTLGHRRIAYFADPVVEDSADRARAAGYTRSMHQAGLAPAIFRWRRDPGRIQSAQGETDFAAILAGGVTGIVSANDLGAIALLDAADRFGVAVPERLSIVGYDDIAVAGLARIALTTLAQPQQDLAELALHQLAARMEGRLAGPPMRQRVEARLVERGSTAATREASS